PFQSSTEISLAVPIDENDMASLNYKLYNAQNQNPRVCSYSFSSNWYQARYILRVHVEMSGCTSGGPTLQAEVPVLHPEACGEWAGAADSDASSPRIAVIQPGAGASYT